MNIDYRPVLDRLGPGLDSRIHAAVLAALAPERATVLHSVRAETIAQGVLELVRVAGLPLTAIEAQVLLDRVGQRFPSGEGMRRHGLRARVSIGEAGLAVGTGAALRSLAAELAGAADELWPVRQQAQTCGSLVSRLWPRAGARRARRRWSPLGSGLIG